MYEISRVTHYAIYMVSDLTMDMALNYALVILFDFNGGCYVSGMSRTWN
jgi:hypothetical protein